MKSGEKKKRTPRQQLLQCCPAQTKLLEFELVSNDGGEFSSAYTCENMLQRDSAVYCTKEKENVNIILRYKYDRPVTITHIMVKAPEDGFSAPFGEALLFISHDFPQISNSTQFDGYDKRAYNSYFAEKQSKDQPVTLTDPVVYLQLTKGWCVVYKLATPRSGRYVHLKLLRSRNDGDNIDLQYFALKGFDGPQAFSFGKLS